MIYDLWSYLIIIYLKSEGQMQTSVYFRKIKPSNAAKRLASKDNAMVDSVVKFA